MVRVDLVYNSAGSPGCEKPPEWVVSLRFLEKNTPGLAKTARAQHSQKPLELEPRSPL